MKKRRINKVVRFWYDQFKKEGEHKRAAWYHAVCRANESYDISDATADQLEALGPPDQEDGK